MDSEKQKISDATNGVTPGLENASAPGPAGQSGQHTSYWVLKEEERAKGFVRPVRDTYYHIECKNPTTMSKPIAETYARSPNYYGSTFCTHCKDHFPVGEFRWSPVVMLPESWKNGDMEDVLGS